MKNNSAFRSKGSMKFLSGFSVLIIAIILMLGENNELYDYIFITAAFYNILIILYYKYIK